MENLWCELVAAVAHVMASSLWPHENRQRTWSYTASLIIGYQVLSSPVPWQKGRLLLDLW